MVDLNDSSVSSSDEEDSRKLTKRGEDGKKKQSVVPPRLTRRGTDNGKKNHDAVSLTSTELESNVKRHLVNHAT